MGKPHNSLDIVLPTNMLLLKGAGADVQPCWLRGSVVLDLVEPTTIKEITMTFRGKARVPNATGETSSVLGNNHQTLQITTHEWSFLQGELTHSPTLKAGRHVFPFDLQLKDSLPSTITVPSSLSSIYYKLRATAVRPGFSSNLHAAIPIRILRTFATEALEYQQTLEIENTWPEKLMYSLMVPHKAWAVGDTISTLVKFSPLVKGVRITGITLTLQEHLKTLTRAGPTHDSVRPIAVAKYEFRDGHAVPVHSFDQLKSSARWPPPTTWSSTALSDGARTPIYDGTNPVDPFAPGFNASGSNGTPPSIHAGNEPFNFAGPSSASTSQSASPYALRSAASSSDAVNIGDEEIVQTLHLPIPSYVTPTHSVEPIIVNHRLRFNIFMTNPDGHISELRCSLPMHILDHVLLEEARAATRVTRRLIFGLEEAQGSSHEDDVELPSYPAHVMDRVPDDENMGGVALDYVNSQLSGLNSHSRVNSVVSPVSSAPTSRHASRPSSRAVSPERDGGRHAELGGRLRTGERGRAFERDRHHTIFSLKPFTKVTSTLTGSGSSSRQQQSASHSPSTSTQPLPGPPGTTTSTPASLSRPHTPSSARASGPSAPSSTRASPVHVTVSLPPDDPLSRVPHYDVASRGFVGGGVTPLSMLRGLPSYEEAARSGSQTLAVEATSSGLSAAERSLSENDLATRFQSAMRMSRQ